MTSPAFTSGRPCKEGQRVKDNPEGVKGNPAWDYLFFLVFRSTCRPLVSTLIRIYFFQLNQQMKFNRVKSSGILTFFKGAVITRIGIGARVWSILLVWGYKVLHRSTSVDSSTVLDKSYNSMSVSNSPDLLKILNKSMSVDSSPNLDTIICWSISMHISLT